MTFVLENRIKKKDLPILGLDDLGLPRLGKKILFTNQIIMILELL